MTDVEVWFLEITNSFSMTQEIMFHTQEDAIKAKRYLEENDKNGYTYSIYNGSYPQPVTFEKWKAWMERKKR